jgi:uncharacterized membrane protein
MKKIIIWLLAIIVALLIIALVAGSLMGKLSFESEVAVEAPIDFSWEVFQDPSDMHKWLIGFKEIVVVEGSPGVIGSKYKLTFEQSGEVVEMTETITRMEPPNAMGFDLSSDFLDGQIEILFTHEDGITRIHSANSYRGNGPINNLVLMMVEGEIVDQDQSNLNRLKELIESRYKSENPDA